MRIRFRNLRQGEWWTKHSLVMTLFSHPASVERRKAQYIYNDDNHYYFMDIESFEQFPMSESDW
ncbi:MAG: hypothetical protein CM1200mP3_12780 [Chloroflexota bacterium]|nr:MAG: hypothetical protein CM1200mP3_12780 [Chloroflexota bacterium]